MATTAPLPGKVTAERSSRLLIALLAFAIFYIPNQSRFPDFNITGLNISNLLFLAMIGILLTTKKSQRDSAPLKKIFILLFALLIWGFVIGQINGSPQPLEDLQALKNAIFYILFYFIAYHAAKDKSSIWLLFLTILFTTFFDSYLGLRQALDYGIASYNETRRVAAPFSWNAADSNRAAAFLCIYLMPMAAIAFYYKSNRLLRWLALGALTLGVFVDFFTYSRQSYGILATLFLLFFYRKNKILAILALIALLNYHLWLPDAAIARIDMTVENSEKMPGVAPQPLSKELDASTESRFIIWSGAWRMIQDFPLGIGLNNFHRNIGDYVPAFKGFDAHNFYVLSATESSVITPIVVIILVIGIYSLGRRLEKNSADPEAKVYGVGLSMAALAVLMVNLYGSRFLDGNVMSNFWILAGLVARYSALTREQNKTATTKYTDAAATPAKIIIRRSRR